MEEEVAYGVDVEPERYQCRASSTSLPELGQGWSRRL